MRSVCAFSLSKSNFEMSQLRTISLAASCGMIPSRPWTIASALSISMYYAVRFSSDQTCRIAALVKLSPKMRESMMVAAMMSPWLGLPGIASSVGVGGFH
jgi:hypothetical protein